MLSLPFRFKDLILRMQELASEEGAAEIWSWLGGQVGPELARALVGYALGEFVAEDRRRLERWLGARHPLCPAGAPVDQLLAEGAFLASASEAQLQEHFAPRGFDGLMVREVALWVMAQRVRGEVGFGELRLKEQEVPNA